MGARKIKNITNSNDRQEDIFNEKLTQIVFANFKTYHRSSSCQV
jgi:hypothetical protein